MTVLLDTHVILWWQTDDARLGEAAREAIATADLVLVSAVSGWEMTIKASLGRLKIREPFPALLAADDFTELPMTLAHTDRLSKLPSVHADPFDRMLIAQALAEQATFITHDRALAPYGMNVIWT